MDQETQGQTGQTQDQKKTQSGKKKSLKAKLGQGMEGKAFTAEPKVVDDLWDAVHDHTKGEMPKEPFEPGGAKIFGSKSQFKYLMSDCRQSVSVQSLKTKIRQNFQTADYDGDEDWGLVEAPPRYKASDNKLEDLKNRLKARGMKIRLNQDTGKPDVMHPNGKWKEMDDNFESRLYFLLDEMRPIDDTKAKTLTFKTFERGIKAFCNDNPHDPFTNWINDGPDWDKKPRLERFLENIFEIKGERDKQLARWALKGMMLAILYRADMANGYKFDEMVTFIGSEGCGKSTFPELILPEDKDWVAKMAFSDSKKDQVHIMLSKKIIEIDELSGARKTDHEKIKSLVSAKADDVRLTWGKYARKYYRRCVFLATTNRGIPSDLSSMRRYVPIRVARKKIGDKSFKAWKDFVRKARRQLWAEALFLFSKDTPAGLPENLKELAKEACEDHRSGNFVFEEAFLEEIDGLQEFKMSEIMKRLKDGYGDENGVYTSNARTIDKFTPQNWEDARLLAEDAGFEYKKPRKDGKQVRRWIKVKKL